MLDQSRVTLAWFVLACFPGSEKKITEYAVKRGCECYFPIERRYRPPSAPGRVRPRSIDEYNLTPGYLFLRFDEEPLFWLFRPPDDDAFPPPSGIIGFLGHRGTPTRISPAIIENLRERECAGEFDYTIKRGRHVLPKAAGVGAPVMIVDGPFANLSGVYPRGIVERIKNSFTVSVRVQDYELLGKKPLIDIPLAFLRFA